MAQQVLRTEQLEYELPPELIATRPAQPRDSARMLVMSRSGDQIEHRHVRDLPEYLHAGDRLVFNTTAVAPARMTGHRIDTGGRIEGLFLNELASENGLLEWRVMLKAGGRLKPGVRIALFNSELKPSEYSFQLLRQEELDWIVRLEQRGETPAILQAVGRTPLPPYILHARGSQALDDKLDRAWYQTIYADVDQRHSVAAPTAGLHFTLDLLAKLKAQGVERLDVALHVGAGTFKPITAATLDQHRMHAESYEVSAEALGRLRHRAPGSRLFAVGTTTVRTLESLPQQLDLLSSSCPELCGTTVGMTDLMIAPPYDFKLVDGLLTNFHLPRSTLLALVAAMLGEAGEAAPALDRLKAVYREAIKQRYRFYSYGDAMLILP